MVKDGEEGLGRQLSGRVFTSHAHISGFEPPSYHIRHMESRILLPPAVTVSRGVEGYSTGQHSMHPLEKGI